MVLLPNTSNVMLVRQLLMLPVRVQAIYTMKQARVNHTIVLHNHNDIAPLDLDSVTDDLIQKGKHHLSIFCRSVGSNI